MDQMMHTLCYLLAGKNKNEKFIQNHLHHFSILSFMGTVLSYLCYNGVIKLVPANRSIS